MSSCCESIETGTHHFDVHIGYRYTKVFCVYPLTIVLLVCFQETTVTKFFSRRILTLAICADMLQFEGRVAKVGLLTLLQSLCSEMPQVGVFLWACYVMTLTTEVATLIYSPLILCQTRSKYSTFQLFCDRY